MWSRQTHINRWHRKNIRRPSLLRIMSTQSGQSSAPQRTGQAGSPGLARWALITLVFILLELLTGLYLVFVGITMAGAAAHVVFGALAGISGIVSMVYAYRASVAAGWSVVGFLFLLVAGIAGLLWYRGASPPDLYAAIMGLGFVVSGAAYSFVYTRAK